MLSIALPVNSIKTISAKSIFIAQKSYEEGWRLRKTKVEGYWIFSRIGADACVLLTPDGAVSHYLPPKMVSEMIRDEDGYYSLHHEYVHEWLNDNINQVPSWNSLGDSIFTIELIDEIKLLESKR